MKITLSSLLILFLCSLYSSSLIAQVDKIHIGNGPDVESAILQIDAIDRGFLIPRLTVVERQSIVAPTQGLLIYEKDINQLRFRSINASWRRVFFSKSFGPTKIIDIDGDTSLGMEAQRFILKVKEIEKFKFSVDSLVLAGGNHVLVGNSVTGSGNKLLLHESKASLRAGEISGNQWDEVNMGFGSFAAGINNTAQGDYSAAWGDGNLVQGEYSIGFGKNNTVAGSYSSSWGLNNEVSGSTAVSWGINNISSASNSTTMGNSCSATGGYSTAWGFGGDATNFGATAFGYVTEASGLFSTVWGSYNIASGDYSTAFGNYTVAESTGETALGTFPKMVDAGSERIFSIGNGTDDINRSNAIEIVKTGETKLWGDYESIVESGEVTAVEFLKEELVGNDLETAGYQFVYNGASDLFHLTRKNLGDPAFNIATWKKDGKLGLGMVPVDNLLEVDGDASKTTPGNWAGNSDRRLKKNILALSDEEALNKVLSMRGVFYYWDDQVTGYKRPESKQAGFIAQELAELFPTKVTLGSEGYLMAAYGTYDPIFAQAFKEQESQLGHLAEEKSELQKILNIASTVQSLNFDLSTELEADIVKLQEYLKQ